MIWRVRNRRILSELRLKGRKIRSGPVSVVYLPIDTPYPQLAFALTKRFGNAVVRNRARRRLREAFRQACSSSAVIPEGAFMITASPKVSLRSFTDLVACFEQCLKKIASGAK